jgi:hypothetical protein
LKPAGKELAYEKVEVHGKSRSRLC